MSGTTTQSRLVQDLYEVRFRGEHQARKKVWQCLATHFFQKYIRPQDTVVEIAAGYCDFINAIDAKTKWAVDINPDTSKYAHGDVKVLLEPSDKLTSLPPQMSDVAFVSNFFEHLSKPMILATLKEIHRILKPGGKLLILQPNILYCSDQYWRYFDHITPLCHHSLSEALEMSDYRVEHVKPRFLPYSMKDKLPTHPFFVRLYLMLPFLHPLVGKQCFIIAKKHRRVDHA